MLERVPDLPPGYRLTVTDPGRGWRSFGWLLELEGELVAVRRGDGTALEAASSAWAHHRRQDLPKISPG